MTPAFFFFRQEIVENPFLSDLVLYLYFFALLILFTFGAHGFVMVYHYLKRREEREPQLSLGHEPQVTIQLPVYNEYYVVGRLIRTVCAMDYPNEKL